MAGCLVGSDGLVHPGAELGDAGVHSGHGGGAGSAAPGHDAHQGPSTGLLAHQGAARVSLRWDKRNRSVLTQKTIETERNKSSLFCR